MILYSNIKIS